MANLVRTVYCPECKRGWTGSFPEGDRKETKLCKDCASDRIAEEQGKAEKEQVEE